MKEFLQKKLKEADALISTTEKSLKKAPEGTLVLSQSKGTVQYYHKTEGSQKKGKYISTKNSKFIISLAQKDYGVYVLRQRKSLQTNFSPWVYHIVMNTL